MIKAIASNKLFILILIIALCIPTMNLYAADEFLKIVVVIGLGGFLIWAFMKLFSPKTTRSQSYSAPKSSQSTTTKKSAYEKALEEYEHAFNLYQVAKFNLDLYYTAVRNNKKKADPNTERTFRRQLDNARIRLDLAERKLAYAEKNN